MTTFGFTRRLTDLYADTKTSCDAVVEQDTTVNVPETNTLHRKFRLQKDRLVAWGLEWSDSSKGKPLDMDESVERAGLTETVTSVLGNIKDILEEAERMQHAGQPTGEKSFSNQKSGNRPLSDATWAASDRTRYEDLAKDLTASIDTLYDLARSRRAYWESAHGVNPTPSATTAALLKPQSVFSAPEYNASDLTLVNPSTISTTTNVSFRSGLPPKLDPSDLHLPEEEPPPYENVSVPTSTRLIGRLRQSHSSTNPWKTDGGRTVETPVLVEYADFDSAYQVTGVPLPHDRLDALLSILVRLAGDHAHGTLQCLGYFEDSKQPRIGLVYQLPSFVYHGPSDSYKQVEDLRPVTLLSVLQTGSKFVHNSNSQTPPLEDRFRLAFLLALTFSKIHGDGFVHKDVNSSNILVFRKNRPLRQSSNSRALQYNLRSPFICSFDLFSEYDLEPTTTMSSSIYRHPEDPKAVGDKSRQYGPQFDLYGLGLVLLEIGLWQPLPDLYKEKYTLADFKIRIEEVYIRRLASKCGTAYMQVVRDCFLATDRIATGAESAQDFGQVYNRIKLRLQRCCLLDEVDQNLEWGDLSSTHIPGSTSLKRKPTNTAVQVADSQPTSPSTYRSAKRYISEKGSQILERKRSQNKSSPKLSSLSRSESKSSQHSLSFRQTLSQSLHNLTSPKEQAPEPMDWKSSQESQETFTLTDSATLVPSTQGTSPTLTQQLDLFETSSLYREKASIAASIIQRAWRTRDQRPLSFQEYKDKIMIIQKHWRQRAEGRTVRALIEPTHVYAQATLGYPTPEPEVQAVESMETNGDCITSSIQIQTDMEPAPRPKLRLHAVKFAPEIVDEWHTTLLPRLERLVGRALRDSEETVSMDLVGVGETQATAKPTIFVTCSSTAKVKSVLNKKLRYDERVFDLKVRRGKVRRSKLNKTSRRTRLPHRSMMNDATYEADMPVMNPFHQERPLCGASIGAFRGEHLPPVSYGGVVLVDDEPLGMSVHHLLDAPSEDDDSEYGEEAHSPNPDSTTRSSAQGTVNPWLAGMGSQPGVQLGTEEPMFELEISDDEDAMQSDEDTPMDFDSDIDMDSDAESDSDSDSSDQEATSTTSRNTVGDIAGIPKGRGDHIKITQPALDDIEADFFPCPEDRDEEHLFSHELGHVHASSGIRRWERDGIVHEIDWALLKLSDNRLQPYNLIQGGRRYSTAMRNALWCPKLKEPVCRRYYSAEEDEYPSSIAPASSLGGLGVHCFGRTSGLAGGVVGAVMSSVRIYRRRSFSRSWHVVGGFGVGGDSGAWVVENTRGRVVGHVLAWCARNKLAYICPMEVLLEDIKRSVGARRVYLPGSEEAEQHVIEGRSPNGRIEVGVRGGADGIILPDITNLNIEGRRERDERGNLSPKGLRSRLNVGDGPPNRMEIVGGIAGGQLA